MKDSEQGFFGFLAGTAFSASRSISNSMYAASERRSAAARADAVAFTDGLILMFKIAVLASEVTTY